jgi:hypothetical protein
MAATSTLSHEGEPPMQIRTFLLLVMLVAGGCRGDDKHLPSSNPAEYDPKKVYTSPATAAVPSPPANPARPAELQSLESQLQELERAANRSEWKKVPFNQDWLQVFQGVNHPCEALSKLVPALGSTQLYKGHEGTALSKAFGPDAGGVARRMDEQLAEGLKHSLGPAAAECPIAVPPQKGSGLFQLPFLVLTRGSSGQSLLFAQAGIPDRSQDDYDINKPPMRTEDAPPDWVGYKTTDTMTRIGKPPRMEGVYESYEMVIAPKAKRCPHLEGPDLKGIVDGMFEWSFVMTRRAMGQVVLYRRHVVATLKGEVDDEAKITRVNFDVAVTLQHIGTELAAYSQLYRDNGYFTLDQRTGLPEELRVIDVSGFSEGEGQAKDAQLLGTLTALMAYFSGPEYFTAQTYWNNPNTCVEIVFTPPTKTQRFAASRTYQVKTELRSKKAQAMVPAKFKEANERPREGNGNVTPREGKSERGTPATFTYRAPGTRVPHSGFLVHAVSRAGVAKAADGEWELMPSGYVLEFTSHIVQEPLNLVNPQFGMFMSSNGFDAHVEATVPLQRRDDGEWVGEGVMQYATRTKTQPAQCEIRIQGTGTTTFHVNGGSISSDPEPFAVSLTILPGQSGEVAETHCTSGNTPEKLRELFATQGVQGGGEAHSTTKGGGWSGAFNFTRYQTFNWNKKGYDMGGWTQVVNSDVVAKKTMSVNCSIGLSACHEETTLVLRRADEPGGGAP